MTTTIGRRAREQTRARHPDQEGYGERPPPPYSFHDVLDTDEGWAKENRHYWLRDRRGCRGRLSSDPHPGVALQRRGALRLGRGQLRRVQAAQVAAQQRVGVGRPGLLDGADAVVPVD